MKSLILVFCALPFFLAESLALPRFASRTGAKCQSCHVNPSGGGMRQTFGVQYGRDQLPVPTWSGDYALDDFSTDLSDVVSIGADVRTLLFYQQIPDTGTTTASASNMNAFWQMQGDLYMNLRLAKKVSIYLDKGLYSGFEVFGLLNILPERGFIKVGKFVPNYGLKMDDHRTLIREVTGFSAERGRPELTGAEVAIAPGQVMLSGGVFNSSDGFGQGTGNQKAFLGRGEAVFKAGSEVHIGIGANVFTRKSAGGTRTTLLGTFGSFSVSEFTIIGEADIIQTKAGATTVDGLVAYLEANYMVTPGVDLKVAYDFYDADTDIKRGSRSRYSFGLEFFPMSGVEVRPIYRINKEDPVDVKNDEFQLLIHFYL